MINRPVVRQALTLDASPPFDLAAVVRSHGWYLLAPVRWDDATGVLATTVALNGSVVDLSLRQTCADPPKVTVAWLGDATSDAVAAVVQRMLHLDADFEEFHRRCTRRRRLRHVAARGLGRLLRSPTVWEDVVKVLCTTNISWSGTCRMAARLVSEFGARGPSGQRAFPAPAAVASAGPAELRARAGLGYRAERLAGLAARVVTGSLDLSDWARANGRTDALRATIQRTPGFGPYASASVLALLGRYDFLPVDSDFLATVARRHFGGERPSRRDAEAVYACWGKWKYLAYWFETDG